MWIGGFFNFCEVTMLVSMYSTLRHEWSETGHAFQYGEYSRSLITDSFATIPFAVGNDRPKKLTL